MNRTEHFDVMRAVRFDDCPYQAILTPRQYRYYAAYFRDGKTMQEISIENDVDISTICRVIKNARKRIIDYYKG